MTSLADKPWLASYAPGVPHDIETPAGSLADLIAESVAQYGDAVALEFFESETSYRELGEQIERAAAGLRALGVEKGDIVALSLPNCPQHIVAFYAALRLGAIVVEHNPLYTPEELAHQFGDHGARFAIVWDKVVATLQGFDNDLRPATIVSVDITRAMPRRMRILLRLPIKRARDSRAALTTSVTGTVTWERLVRSAPLAGAVEGPAVDDTALIQYTTGTTGHPKGAVLSHANLVVNAAQARAWVPQIERGNGTVYAILPMFHAYGLTLCLTFAMSMGHRLVLFPRFDPALVLPVIRQRPPTFLPAVPPIYDRLAKAAAAEGVSLRGVQVAISGAMPLSPAVVDPWEAATGGYLVEGYGLSECSPVLTANPVSELRRAGWIGLPLPGTELRVMDPDTLQDVPLGEPGELLVKGPQVFSGYWGRPDDTAKVFHEGWFRTGDIVVVDEEGFVKVVDRIKELVITGGFNVAPSEVEEVLTRFPGVAEAAVVGIPNERDGEHVVAAIVTEGGASVDAEALRAFAREHLAAYKIPRRVVEVAELPRSLIGKVIRRKVREALVEQGVS